MAHQYTAAPPYSAQYQSASYHSPFPPSTGQQLGSNTAGFQQMNLHHQNLQSSSSLSNTARYDTNAQVYPQPASLPFAPQFYPDFLKHFPPPPPPPLPSSHFAAAPGTPTGFPHFPQNIGTPPHPISQQAYSQFPQSSTPLNTSSSTHDQNTYGRMIPAKEAGATPDSIRKSGPATLGVSNTTDHNPPGAQTYSGAENTYNDAQAFAESLGKNMSVEHGAPDRSSSHNGDKGKTLSKSQLQINTKNNGEQPVQHLELRERAKAALLSLVPHNIRYNDFLAEGVSAQTLQQLYEELGLNWRANEEKEAKTNSEKTAVVIQSMTTANEPASDTPTGPPGSKTTNTAMSLSGNSTTMSSSMERKDRIAQLLAAKAGKTTASGATSQSGSPASIAESIPTSAQETGNNGQSLLNQQSRPTRTVSQIESLESKTKGLDKENVVKVTSSEQGPPVGVMPRIAGSNQKASTIDSTSPQPVPLSTPMKIQLAEAGLASLIPGLFMTSNDTEDNSVPEDRSDYRKIEAPNDTSTESQVRNEVGSSPGQLSRKRSAPMDQSLELEQHEAKRHAVEPKNPMNLTPNLVAGENIDNDDNASEGEIVEDIPVLEDAQTPLVHAQIQLHGQTQTVQQVEIDNVRKQDSDKDKRKPFQHVSGHATSPNGFSMTAPSVPSNQQAALGPSALKSLDQSARIDERTCPSPIALVKATPEQIAERAAQLKADFLRQRALRQSKPKEGVPIPDEEVVKTQDQLRELKARIAEIQKEIEQYEGKLTHAREVEKQVLREVETLEKQVSESISGHRQISSESGEAKQQTSKTLSQSESVSTSPQTTTPNEELQTSNTMLPGLSSELPSKSNASEQSNDHIKSQDTNSQNSTESNTQHLLPTASLDSENFPITRIRVDTDNGIGATIQNGLADKSVLLVDGASDSNHSTKYVTQSDGDPNVLLPVMHDSDSESDDSHMSIDEESDDSASLSDSGSEDYEPAEPELLHASKQQPDLAERGADTEVALQHDKSLEQQEEGDEYEPADDMSISSGSTTTPASLKNQMPLNVNPVNHGDQMIDEAYETQPITQISSVAEQPRNDDQEKGTQLSEANILTKTQNVIEALEEPVQHVLGEEEASTTRYVPYSSPLTAFKSYRFNPTFRDQTKDGYRSLTYSHKIDSTLPLCPNELDGNACADPECQNQHFGSMALTDDKILVQMSSATDIKDKALRDQYLLGLKQVIAQLRLDGVKEFSDVAAALSRYRRDWSATHMSL